MKKNSFTTTTKMQVYQSLVDLFVLKGVNKNYDKIQQCLLQGFYEKTNI